LHIYNSYDYDYDQSEQLLTFEVNVTELEKYQVLVCFCSLSIVPSLKNITLLFCRVSPA